MKQIPRQDDGAQGQTKVLGEIGGAGFIDELRMANDIPDVLTHSNLVVKVGGICASCEEGVTRIYGFADGKGF